MAMFGVGTKRAFRHLDVVGREGRRNSRSVFWHSQADVKIGIGHCVQQREGCQCPDKSKANK